MAIEKQLPSLLEDSTQPENHNEGHPHSSVRGAIRRKLLVASFVTPLLVVSGCIDESGGDGDVIQSQARPNCKIIQARDSRDGSRVNYYECD